MEHVASTRKAHLTHLSQPESGRSTRAHCIAKDCRSCTSCPRSSLESGLGAAFVELFGCGGFEVCLFSRSQAFIEYDRTSDWRIECLCMGWAFIAGPFQNHMTRKTGLPPPSQCKRPRPQRPNARTSDMLVIGSRRGTASNPVAFRTSVSSTKWNRKGATCYTYTLY